MHKKLNEATANYDIESEAAVNRFIGEELHGKTTVIISHKPDILKYVDKVIVLEKGRVVDVGKELSITVLQEAVASGEFSTYNGICKIIYSKLRNE